MQYCVWGKKKRWAELPDEPAIHCLHDRIRLHINLPRRLIFTQFYCSPIGEANHFCKQFLKFACTLLNRGSLYLYSTKGVMIKGRSLLYFDLYLSPVIVIRIRYFAVFLLCLVIPLVLLMPDLGLSPCKGTVSRDFLLQSVSTISIFF